MKTASELRKSLDEALKPDTSGKTTPIQRLTPFLRDLVEYLQVTESLATIRYWQVQFLVDQLPTLEPDDSGGWAETGPVSSDAPTQAVPASPTNEPGSASKAST